ncbi:hypothetical protein KFL_010150010, partial [Klebsormidium nitens]
NASKKDYLEFMVPWWELQIGVSVAQLIRLVSSGDSSIRSATLLTMFPGGVEERLVQDFRLHPKGRTKMIALAVQGADDTNSRKEELINAKFFWQQPGKVEALKAAIATYGQSWAKIKERCEEFQDLQTSQLKDKWKSLVRVDQTLAGISSPGKRGRPARTSLVELDENGDDFAEARAQLERETQKNVANKQQLDLASQRGLALRRQLATVEKENEALSASLNTLNQQQQELELEIRARREFAGELRLKLHCTSSRVRELLTVCAEARTVHEGLSVTLEAETQKAASLRRSEALMASEVSAIQDRIELARIEAAGVEKKVCYSDRDRGRVAAAIERLSE